MKHVIVKMYGASILASTWYSRMAILDCDSEINSLDDLIDKMKNSDSIREIPSMTLEEFGLYQTRPTLWVLYYDDLQCMLPYDGVCWKEVKEVEYAP
jgi:hypothetical protein